MTDHPEAAPCPTCGRVVGTLGPGHFAACGCGRAWDHPEAARPWSACPTCGYGLGQIGPGLYAVCGCDHPEAAAPTPAWVRPRSGKRWHRVTGLHPTRTACRIVLPDGSGTYLDAEDEPINRCPECVAAAPGGVGEISQRFLDGSYVYESRKAGDPMRGVEQDGDYDVERLLDRVAHLEAENARKDQEWIDLLAFHNEQLAEAWADRDRNRRRAWEYRKRLRGLEAENARLRDTLDRALGAFNTSAPLSIGSLHSHYEARVSVEHYAEWRAALGRGG